MTASTPIRSTCRACNAELPPGKRRCPQCGTDAITPTVLHAVKSAEESITPTHQRALRPEVLDDKWQLEGLIGEGGMGSVYQATDIHLKRRVAIKMLSDRIAENEEFVRRFEREAQTMASLDHPNLLPVYAVGRHRGRPFLVMKYLEGESLDRKLQRARGGLPKNEAISLCTQIASGLSFMHARGTVHRDLKPANVFVDQQGRPIILDFGLVRTRESGLTQTGFAVGTPGYMSPEQMIGDSGVDHRTDIYSLGVMMFEIVTGTSPFNAKSDFELLLAHRDQPVPNASAVSRHVPVAVAAVLSRALAKNKEDRYADAADFATAFSDAWSSSLGAPTQPALTSVPKPTKEEPSASPSKGIFLYLGIGAAIAAVAGIALFVASSRTTTAKVEPPVQPKIAAVEQPAPKLVEPSPVLKTEQMEKQEPPPEKHEEPHAEAIKTAEVKKPAVHVKAPPVKVKEAAGIGRVVVVAKVKGERRAADVLVDGVPRGGTGEPLEVPAGDHVITVTVSGFSPKALRIRVVAGQVVPVAIAIE